MQHYKREKEFSYPRIPTWTICQAQEAQSHPSSMVLCPNLSSLLSSFSPLDLTVGKIVVGRGKLISSLLLHCGLPDCGWPMERGFNTKWGSASWPLHETRPYFDENENVFVPKVTPILCYYLEVSKKAKTPARVFFFFYPRAREVNTLKKTLRFFRGQKQYWVHSEYITSHTYSTCLLHI